MKSKRAQRLAAAFLMLCCGLTAGAQTFEEWFEDKTLGFNYPKAFVYNNSLYVCYSVNKEDVQCTMIPILKDVIIDTYSITSK